MEQIYYTQCPMGYGLGISNGFQVKRISPDYPASADFRHLGYRAYPAGSRVLAPWAVRYRRENEVVEIAALSPRTHEYQTEGRDWGRPGGHFAHGLRGTVSELSSIEFWPAGLRKDGFWCREEREPSRGRVLEPLKLTAGDLFIPPRFADLVSSVSLKLDHRSLAGLLTAAAIAAREERTLFLVDQVDPERLGPLVALLTYAFPRENRAWLTFSTYHDRPEELHGFRIQGTSESARPNVRNLMTMGIVARIAAGSVRFEPEIAPERWAETVAGRLINRTPEDESAWRTTEELSKRAAIPANPSDLWTERRLAGMFQLHDAVKPVAKTPADAREWAAEKELGDWAREVGIAAAWSRARGPDWWRRALGGAPASDGLREALLSVLDTPEAWAPEDRAPAWATLLAETLIDASPTDREEAVSRILKTAPRRARPSLLHQLVRAWPREVSAPLLNRLRAASDRDESLWLPLEARGAIANALKSGDGSTAVSLVARARSSPGALVAVLDAVAAEVAEAPVLTSRVAALVESAFDDLEGFLWALRQGASATIWLKSYLLEKFADPRGSDRREALLRGVPPAAFPILAATAVEIAADPRASDESFRWAVERILLAVEPGNRPWNPKWPGMYVDRTRSDLMLSDRLFAIQYRKLRLKAWIDRAREAGALSQAQLNRLANIRTLAHFFHTKEPDALLKYDLAATPREDRGRLLQRVLSRSEADRFEDLQSMLDRFQDAWVDEFAPGSPGLKNHAKGLAETGFLSSARDEPEAWFRRLCAILSSLGLTERAGRGFEPDGLASEILAATNRSRAAERELVWGLRRIFLDHPASYRALSADIRDELRSRTAQEAVEVCRRWDRALRKSYPELFWEVFLNSCDGPHLFRVVCARARDLSTLPDIPWWGRSPADSSDAELREGFLRTAPIAPIDMNALAEVKRWIETPSHQGDFEAINEPAKSTRLSSLAKARWICIERLSRFHSPNEDGISRSWSMLDWRNKVPVERLNEDDRYRFLAWAILGIDDDSMFQTEAVATWLVSVGIDRSERVASWADELEAVEPVSDAVRRDRSKLVGGLREEVRRIDRGAS